MYSSPRVRQNDAFDIRNEKISLHRQDDNDERQRDEEETEKTGLGRAVRSEQTAEVSTKAPQAVYDEA
jgi:hypothetical protein